MAASFELRSLPDERGKPRVFLVQLPLRTKHLDAVADIVTRGRLDGATLELAEDAIVAMLRDAGATFDRPSSEPGVEPAGVFDVDRTLPVGEADAIRLSLIFNAVNSLRSEDKVQAIIDGISAMPIEQATAWMSMISANEESGRKALIVYLAEG